MFARTGQWAHAFGVDAHQATLTFAPGILQRVAQSYRGEIPDPLRRRLLGIGVRSWGMVLIVFGFMDRSWG